MSPNLTLSHCTFKNGPRVNRQTLHRWYLSTFQIQMHICYRSTGQSGVAPVVAAAAAGVVGTGEQAGPPSRHAESPAAVLHRFAVATAAPVVPMAAVGGSLAALTGAVHTQDQNLSSPPKCLNLCCMQSTAQYQNGITKNFCVTKPGLHEHVSPNLKLSLALLHSKHLSNTQSGMC